MQAGRLRHRVTLETSTEAADAYGQSQPTWAEVGTYWAAIRGVSAKEAAIADQLNASVTQSVTLRYIGQISPRDRIIYNGRTLNVVYANNSDEMNREWRLLCVEAV